MITTARQWLGYSLVAAAAAFIAACSGETPVGPDRQPAVQAELAPTATLLDGIDLGGPDLGSCDSLAAPGNARLAFHTFATGVQIYRWSGTSWTFVAPSATLYLTPNELVKVGTHYAGPTWEAIGGSKVVGAVSKRCTPNANAIPWLLLNAVSNEGPGVFARVTHIQRVNTVGGNAPATPGTAAGDEARIPYTAEYFFYRAK